jgi:predicted glycoside hydrolase/deacetylase ChbG (UPF0249 family)
VPPKRFLIVNADDFGLSPGVNAGVIAAHERGIVTSASLMVRWPAAQAAVEYARNHPEISLGLHIDIGEWSPRHGEWVPVYEVVPRDQQEMVEAEVHRQLESFRELTGTNPTHLDSHQHVHGDEPAGTVLRKAARELGVPLRRENPRIRYRGDLYGRGPFGEVLGDAISVDKLIEVIRGLEAGITELGCHPGQGNDAGSEYGEEREAELAVLCDQRVRETIEREGIVLCSFTEVAL